MELFLNLLWLMIALVALGMFHRSVGRDAGSAGQRRNGWVALVCALVLLFFVISLTDDLHQEVVFIEDASLSRKQVTALHSVHAQAPAAHHAHHLFAAIVPEAAFSPELTLAQRLAALSSRCATSRIFSEPGRGPPLLFL
jgi:hypothetical protein